MNDGAGLEQDAHRGEQHKAGADRQLQAADLEEHAGQGGAQQDKETGGDKASQEAHVLAGGQHVGRQAAEHQGGHGKG